MWFLNCQKIRSLILIFLPKFCSLWSCPRICTLGYKFHSDLYCWYSAGIQTHNHHSDFHRYWGKMVFFAGHTVLYTCLGIFHCLGNILAGIAHKARFLLGILCSKYYSACPYIWHKSCRSSMFLKAYKSFCIFLSFDPNQIQYHTQYIFLLGKVCSWV